MSTEDRTRSCGQPNSSGDTMLRSCAVNRSMTITRNLVRPVLNASPPLDGRPRASGLTGPGPLTPPASPDDRPLIDPEGNEHRLVHDRSGQGAAGRTVTGGAAPRHARLATAGRSPGGRVARPLRGM